MPFCFQILNKFYSRKSVSPPQSNLTVPTALLLPLSTGLLLRCRVPLLAPRCFGKDPDSGMLQELPFVQCLPSSPIVFLSTERCNTLLQLSAARMALRYRLFLPPNSDVVIIGI